MADCRLRNLRFQVDCVRGFVWFVATRAIEAGEELAYMYDENRALDAEENAGEWFSGLTVEGVLRSIR